MKTKSSQIAELKKGRRIALFAVGAALVLVVMKAVVGYVFNSRLLIADAFHSSGDLLAHFASFFGLWLASHKKTTRFPYGLYKAETIACLCIGMLISIAAIEIFREGCHKLFHLSQVQGFPVLPVTAGLISAVVSYVIALKEKAVGQSIGSQSLIATSREAFLDIFASLIVSVGILLAYLRIPYVEGSIIILISLLILKLGLENLWMSLLILMDANLDPELQSEIEEKINQIYGVKGVGDVRIRQSGPFKMVECTIATSPSLSLYKAHELSEKVEDFIEVNYDHIESVFVHVEPGSENVLHAVVPVQDSNGLDSKINRCFARAPYFVVLRLTDSRIDIEDFYYNEYVKDKIHIGVKIVKALVRYKVHLLFAVRVGEISYPILKDNFVDIYSVEQDLSVKEIIAQYRSGQLEPMNAATHGVEESHAATC
jgi:cation diffusion facilitator family transporter